MVDVRFLSCPGAAERTFLCPMSGRLDTPIVKFFLPAFAIDVGGEFDAPLSEVWSADVDGRL
jgi:hypothetical protein